MDPKRYTIARKWAGCKSQRLSLKISPKPTHEARSCRRNSIKQPTNSFFDAVFGHLGTAKLNQKGTQRPITGQDVCPNV
jgi:hypothetical protein